MDDGYEIPAATHRVESVIARSRFVATVAHAATAEEARAFVDEVRRAFADATHNCWAYVAGPPGSTAAVGMSDAGEPHGTAGRPMLDVLLHSRVGEVAVVVTRYFGGTRLGKGGLVRAYGGCVQQALATLPRTLRVAREAMDLEVGYADNEPVRRLIEDFGAHILAEEYADSVRYRVHAPVARAAPFVQAVLDRTAGRARIARPEQA